MANRLANETSPYLLQHAENPVDWYPWGAEAFAEAQRREVPILLSIGYSACHWCHVMAHESFENPAIAARMNSLFVNVKVDREERPDVDELYMRAVQAFNRGQGGWPMTVFLTPDGKPFFGGTYFPPTSRGGMPGFVDVLVHVSETWRRHRGEVDRVTTEVVELLEQSGQLPAPARMLSRQWLEPVAEDAIESADPVNGGFGAAPKFPAHGTLAILLAHARVTGDERARDTLVHALDGMARGGMYDLAGGGFCRYSVDAEWRIPHFEKMLYDNGQLVPIYADAWRLTGSPRFARVVRETIAWMLREMRLPHGGFAASLDADSPGHGGHPGGEGAFYAWTPAELTAALGPIDGPRAAHLLDVTAEGTFEHGTSVLRLDRPLDELSEHDRQLVERALPQLLAARNGRPHPGRDDKVIVAWNALAISALARAGAAMGERGWVEAAVNAGQFVEGCCFVGGRLMRTYKDGRAQIPAFADDHANLLQAWLDLWEATYEQRWLHLALALADRIVELFWDDEGGGLFVVGRDQPPLVARSKHPIGGAEPGANGTAALAFVRLSKLCGRTDLAEKAERICRSAQGYLARAPRALGAEVLAGAWLVANGTEIAILGDPKSDDTRTLVDEVRRRVLPFAVTAVLPRPIPELPWTEGKEAIGGRPPGWVCEGWSCKLPVQDAQQLGAQLDEQATRPPPATPPEGARVRAPELPDAPEAWIGTDTPLTLAKLRGNVVVLDFWTYCCINCMHVLPELEAIEERFRDQPVVVLGVHCAKFPAEEVADNVRRAMQRHHVRHPVVHDPVHAVWEEYAVRSWPTVVVVDPEGRIALQQPGEVGREELGQVIEGLLDEGRRKGTLKARVPVPAVPLDAGAALRFPGKVHVWPDAFEQELGNDPLANGYLYVSDTGNHRVLECRLSREPDGWPAATLLRAFGSGDPGLVDGPAAEARFRGPQGVRRHEGTLYVADTENHALREIALGSGEVRTLAGTGRRGTGAPSKQALLDPLTVDLRSPWDVEIMPMRRSHLVFVAMAGSHQIWVYANGNIGIHTGSGREDHVDGPAASAALAQPSALALLGRYLLFADSETSSIRAVDLQAHQVVTVVGRGLFDFGDVDGKGDVVRLQHPLGLTFAGDRVYVADTFNHKVKAIGLQSGETKTLAGGDPDVLREPGGVARAAGFLIVADTNNHRLRAVEIATGRVRDVRIRGL